MPENHNTLTAESKTPSGMVNQGLETERHGLSKLRSDFTDPEPSHKALPVEGFRGVGDGRPPARVGLVCYGLFSLSVAPKASSNVLWQWEVLKAPAGTHRGQEMEQLIHGLFWLSFLPAPWVS